MNWEKIEKKPGETFVEKTWRKCYNEPFVPAGAMITVAFLTFGMRAFRTGDKHQAQIMMRWRVAAQAATVLAMCVGGYLNIKPVDRPKVFDVLKTLAPSAFTPPTEVKKPEN